MQQRSDNGEHVCEVISIESLRQRTSNHINWTHVMPKAAQGKPELAFLIGLNETSVLVLCRAYGDTTSIVLDDTEINETTILRIPTKHFSEFLRPCSKTLVLPGLQEHYAALDAHLTSMNLPVAGPLSSARTVLNMRDYKCSAQEAIKLAASQCAALVAQQVARLDRVDRLMDKPPKL